MSSLSLGELGLLRIFGIQDLSKCEITLKALEKCQP
jgi:hypothetical protein